MLTERKMPIMNKRSGTVCCPQLAALVLLGLLLVPGLGAQNAIRMEDAQADSLFRQGVMRFHDSYHAEAAVLFQRVLSLQPENQLARIWLGKAYYYAGFENSALQEWESVRSLGGASPELVSFMESHMARRGLSQVFDEDAAWFPVMAVDKTNSRPNQFRRPGGLAALPDGTTWMCSFANNSLIRLSPSGKTLRSINGSPARLAGPFDLVLVADQEFYVTQMLSDSVTRLDLAGNFKGSFGGKGSGPGQFLGPQYIAWDGGTYVYVSDMGNRRVSKFDRDGNFVLSLGMRSPSFAGLERPVGLVWLGERLVVADASRQRPALHFFDASGNLLDTFEHPLLRDVEGLSPYAGRDLLVTTRSAVYRLDVTNLELTVLVQAPAEDSRLVAATADANGHILVSDFDRETVTFHSRLSGVYSGLSVQVQRVIADRYPEIVLECTVLDSRGLPVLGLAKENFVLTEGHKPLATFEFLGAGSREDMMDTVILMQGGGILDDAGGLESCRNALGGIMDSLGQRSRTGLVSAGLQAGIEAKLGSPRKELEVALEAIPRGGAWTLDQGLRLAVSQLAKTQGLRHVIFVGDGSLPEDAFRQFGLEENLRYLQNNRVRLSVVNVGNSRPDQALDYLVRESGGQVFPLYAPRGLLDLGSRLLSLRDGSYRFSFKTLFDSDYGRKYLPVEIQAMLFQKSGRDESGYFAPLKL